MSETTQPQFNELLPPEIINMIGRLEFLARTAKVGSINGRHTSPHKGFSVEFAECLASCGTAPVCLVNDDFHEGISPDKAAGLLERYEPAAHSSAGG
jgi:NADH-quinone oxidoreductase subunit E